MNFFFNHILLTLENYKMNLYKTICIFGALAAVAFADSHVMPLTAEIKNEQPYSLDNNAIRVRVFNHGIDTLKQMSFCYRFHANKEFVFEHDWYLPDLNFKVDTLTDTTYQIHFWLKQGAFIAPNSYCPNTSGLVCGLQYRYWFPWEYQLDYSFSSSPVFESTDKLFLSMTDECYDNVVTIDSARIKILGEDKDGNGVRDDLDSLIDAEIPDSPEKRAAYRYLARAIQNQWTAFYDNPQMTYEELLPYQVLISLGISLINNTEAVSKLNFNWFYANTLNTKDRILYEAEIDDVFAGKTLPVAVMKNKKYANIVAKGLESYESILAEERVE